MLAKCWMQKSRLLFSNVLLSLKYNSIHNANHYGLRLHHELQKRFLVNLLSWLTCNLTADSISQVTTKDSLNTPRITQELSESQRQRVPIVSSCYKLKAFIPSQLLNCQLEWKAGDGINAWSTLCLSLSISLPGILKVSILVEFRILASSSGTFLHQMRIGQETWSSEHHTRFTSENV